MQTFNFGSVVVVVEISLATAVYSGTSHTCIVNV